MIVVLLFLFLNFLLFLPRYFLNKETSDFFPFKEIFVGGKIRLRPIISRFNNDVFRINLEYTLLIFLIALFKSMLPFPIAKLVLAIFYLFTLVLFYYHYSIYSIYNTYPSISVDLKLIKQGINVGYNGFQKKFIIGVLLFLFFLIVVVAFNNYLISMIYESNNQAIQICCLLILILTFIFSFIKKINPFRFVEDFDFHYLTYFSIQFSVYLINSNRYFNLKAKQAIENIPKIIENTIIDIPQNLELNQKPNIYFIALESYGAILYENEIYKNEYKKIAEKISENITEKGWKIASTISESPITGGQSWVSYSSLLKGIDIKNDSVYRHLFSQQKSYQTQSIFDILNALDYATYLISGLGGFVNYKIEWETILQFLGTPNVIKYKDLNYQGSLFNLGPSAPDQYLLNKSLALIKEKHIDEAVAFFVETINSHYPFDSPTVLLDDWKECNFVKKEDFKPNLNLSSQQIENYLSAMRYQLKLIEDLVLKETAPSIFVIFGDHQPPILTNQENSYNTPIHIISKNEPLIAEYISKGFENGFYINDYKPSTKLKHHHLKKIFMDAYFLAFQKKL